MSSVAWWDLARIETHRTLRRRGTAALAAVVVVGTVLFGYVLVSALEGLAAADPALDAESRRQLAALASATALSELPTSLATVAATFAPSLGLCLGAVVAAEDYRSRFVKLLVARGASRRSLVSARLLVVALGAAAATAASVGSAVTASIALGPGALVAPRAGELALVVGVTLLCWWAWGVAGLLLTVLTRSGHVAVGLAAVVLVLGPALTTAVQGADGDPGLWGLLPTSLSDQALRGAPVADHGDVVTATAVLLLQAVAAALLTYRVAARQDLR